MVARFFTPPPLITRDSFASTVFPFVSSLPLPPSRSFLPSLLAFPHAREFLRWPKFKVSARRHLISVDRTGRASNDKKTHEDKRQKTKRQRGFPACSQASTNAPQAGLSSLFRWGRLIFCWCERLMGDNVRRVSITMTTCIGRDTLMGHFCMHHASPTIHPRVHTVPSMRTNRL